LLVHFPQTSAAALALRPALVLLDTGDLDVMVARITRQNHGTPYDIVLTDWKDAGLLAASVVRVHKIATLEKSLIQKKLGNLQGADRTAVAGVLATLFAAW
jgi:mRNA interferase MazF